MERVGPYELIREIARGGMGVVYEARHPDLPRTLALKQVLAGEVSPSVLERFRREAEALARVKHPNVVAIHELGASDRGPYLVEALVPGQTLEDRLREGPLEPGEAAEVVAALADAVAAVHEAGILHRDLKPANVILRPDGTPMLLDFGLARDRQAERLTQTGELLGTPAYMAPEQATCDALDERTDVYGLGALLYACLAAVPPFTGPLMVCLHQVVEHEPEWPQAPADLSAILERAMAKSPAQRYPTPAALRDDLRRFARGELGHGLRIAPAAAVIAMVSAVVWLAIRTPTPATPTPESTPSVARSSTAPAPSASDLLTIVKRRNPLPGAARVGLYRRALALAPGPDRVHALAVLRAQPLAVWDANPKGKVVLAVCWGSRVGAVMRRRVFARDLGGNAPAEPLGRWSTDQLNVVVRVRSGVAVGEGPRVHLFGVGSSATIEFGKRHGYIPNRYGMTISGISYDPTTDRLAVIGSFKDALVTDLRTGRTQAVRVAETTAPKEVAIRGDTLAIASHLPLGGQVERFSVASGEAVEAALGMPTTITQLAVGDRGWVAIGGSNGTLRVWDGARDRQLLPLDVTKSWPGIRGIGFVGDRWVVAAASRNQVRSEALLRWVDLRADPPTPRQRDLSHLRVSNLSIGPKGHFLAIGTFDGRIELWATPGEPDGV